VEIETQHGAERAGRGALAGWTVNSMEPNQRLRRYVARVLAWPEANFSPVLDALQSLVFFPGGGREGQS